MSRLELACLTIVIAFWIARGVREPKLGRLFARAVALSVAAWIGEATCIRLYGTYSYSADRWRLFVDVVPLLIPLIWPVVVLSAVDLAKALGLRPRLRYVAATVVLLDAAFIEPVSVHAGLWSWTHGALLGVPLVGVLGWAAFAFGAGLVLERPASWRRTLALAVVPVLTAHAGVLIAWWALLRWLPRAPLPDVIVMGAGLATGTALAAWPFRAPRAIVLQRLPGALFFFGQLVLVTAPTVLWGWAAALALPYFTLLLRSRPKR